ncbi:hypothetical protein QCC37_07330 [Pseudomonas aeruginosa]|uniref:hypothetical protein n=1 Tax=Pseudomonas aeruginosa TaxID=287 RepID=UPI0026E0F7A7|nr:hypothetical protein [Pseudomonas aeruginosa]ELV9478185.1 hypothetical protein [Pseudomonas aeruginosa]MCS8650748.1 hypothetical protein [Pseudomonas aeruginosa]MCS9428796.1 hypothetical protein [Pseudomonas aeruginosa]MCS9561477.1 hypothetical protein [Pseudomonas aeruginosa]MCT0359494.1 hypothetical protein [Pseudomonas aeruginosa]
MEQQHEQDSASSETDLPISPAVIGWGLAAVVFSILCMVFNNSPLVLVQDSS